jgi:3-oxoacyl-[acyl-carrier-protein] synthase II
LQASPKNQNAELKNRNTVYITDAVAVTALGDDLNESWQKILAGASAITPVDRFPVGNYNSKIAACIHSLKPAGTHSMIYSLLDRLLNQMRPVPPDAFLITASTKAGIDNLERYRRGSAAEIQDIQLSSIATVISEKLGLIHKGISISAACASSAVALARGAAMIALGRTDIVLICCLDLVTEFIFSGFSALKALSPIPCQPFDRNRLGLSLGEGATALLMMSPERAEIEQRQALGSIHGWGVANDAAHITAPAKSASGLVQAISQALKIADKQSSAITAINAHGTGTVYNDIMELTAFRQVFGKRKVPTYSVKGAIGHCLGAAGGIEVAIGLQALTSQIVPPTVGLVTPVDEAVGMVSPKPVSISGDYLLTTKSGFGGINAALILGKQAIW